MGCEITLDRIQTTKATRKDLPTIQHILKENGLCFEDIPQVLDMLFMAYKDSNLVGIGGVERHGIYGLLRSLVIQASFRGKGYGKELCSRLVEQAKLHGTKELYLLTTTAQAFFEKLGFGKIDRERAPKAIQDTTEFKELCPVSSICMRMRI
jgi:amino-acid N-acetyltransferase